MNINAIKLAERTARQDQSVVSLSQGIPGRELDARIKHQVSLAINDGLTDAYSDPQGMLELRAMISQDLATEQMNYDTSEIIVTAGAMEALSVALRSVVTADKDQVIVPTPVYAAYFSVISSARGSVVQLPLDVATGWTLDIDKLVASLTDRTAAIMICNPNNPTGTVHSRQTLRQVADLASSRGVTLILDEVYRHMLYDETDFYTPASQEEYRSSVIRVMSFSKDFSMTGWRVGYLQADQSRINELVAIHDTLVNCAPVVSQYAAMAALQYKIDILQRNQQEYLGLRRQVAHTLDRLSSYLEYTMPSAGYFFFPRLKSMSAEEFTRNLLKHQKLAVVPGDSFGRGGEGHFRLCFGRRPDDVQQGLVRLEEYFRA